MFLTTFRTRAASRGAKIQHVAFSCVAHPGVISPEAPSISIELQKTDDRKSGCELRLSVVEAERLINALRYSLDTIDEQREHFARTNPERAATLGVGGVA
jgi:hypothetical protein